MFTPAIDPQGFPIAVCSCDICEDSTTVRAQHTRHRGNEKKKSVVESQVLIKLQAQGWTYIKKTLRCPACEAERVQNFNKPKAMEPEMTTTETPTDLPQPTREQKRLIMDMLNEVYDTKSNRYSGHETDKTVAETLGNGIRHGWVAQLREEFFGPEGGNEELATLEEEVAKWTAEAAQIAANCHTDIQNALAALREYNRLRDKLGEFNQRIDKLKRAVGPKAEHV